MPDDQLSVIEVGDAVAVPASEVWKLRLSTLHVVSLTGPEVEEFTDVLVEAVGDISGPRLINLLNLQAAAYRGDNVFWDASFRRLIQDANGGLIKPNTIREVFVAAITIAPGNQKLLLFGERLEIIAKRNPAPAGIPPTTPDFLHTRHVLAIANELAGFFAGAPIDLAILKLPVGAPAAPQTSTCAAWGSWLTRCPREALETVLGFVALRNPAAAYAAQHELRRNDILAKGNLAQLDTIDDQVVVDREQLAKHVQPMLTGANLILRVDGERGRGKTFTRSVLRALLTQKDGDQIVVDVEIPGKTLETLAAELLEVLGEDASKAPNRSDSTDEKWPERVAEVVVTAAMKAAGQGSRICWLVFDRCNAVSDKDELGRFLKQLARVIETSAQVVNVPRLVLIEASERFTVRRRKVLVETIVPIVKKDIENCLRTRDIDERRISALADDVQKQMQEADDPQEPRRRLEAMQSRILDVLEGVVS